MFRKVFEGVVDYSSDDGGQALIADINEQVPPSSDLNNGMFIRIQSWETENQNSNTPPVHQEARSIEGKKIRVTVEEITPDNRTVYVVFGQWRSGNMFHDEFNNREDADKEMKTRLDDYDVISVTMVVGQQLHYINRG